ncbi:hypothetical protein D3C81_1388080 [compost metagenome]
MLRPKIRYGISAKYGIITSDPAHAIAPGAVRTVITACSAAITPTIWKATITAAITLGLINIGGWFGAAGPYMD